MVDITDIFLLIEQNNNKELEILLTNPEIINIIKNYHYGIMSSILYAIEKNNKGALQLLLKQEIDINRKYKSGKTLAHYVAEKCDIDIMEFLIMKKADINAIDDKGKTPLHYAARKGNIGMVKFLLEKKAKIDTKDNKGKVPLHYASYSYNVDIVELLIEKGSDVNTRDNEGLTPIHYAAYCGNISINSRSLHFKKFAYGYNSFKNLKTVELLIEKKADINARDNHNISPLHCAAYSGNKYIVAFLLKHGAITDVKTKSSETVLHYAAYGTYEALELLLKNIETCYIDEKDTKGRTALHYAAGQGNLKIIKLLLANGSKPIKSKDNYTPHEYAIHHKVRNKTIKGLFKLYEFLNSEFNIDQNKQLTKLYEMIFLDKDIFNISYSMGNKLLKANTGIVEFDEILKDQDVKDYIKSCIKENLIKSIKTNIMDYIDPIKDKPIIKNIVSKLVTDHVGKFRNELKFEKRVSSIN